MSVGSGPQQSPAEDDGLLHDETETLYRQVHPQFWQDGEPTSQVFMPTPKDDGLLSHDRSSLTSAQDSFYRYTVLEKLQSGAIFGLTVGEYGQEQITCFSDPIQATDDRIGNPAHCCADYNQHGSSAQKLKAKRLKRVAVARGQIFPSLN